MSTEIPVVPSPEIHDDGSTDERIQAAAGAHVNVNRIELSDRTVSIAAVVMAAVAIALACWARHDAGIAEREARMYEYYTLEMDAKLIAAGVKRPDEAIAKRKE